MHLYVATLSAIILRIQKGKEETFFIYYTYIISFNPLQQSFENKVLSILQGKLLRGKLQRPYFPHLSRLSLIYFETKHTHKKELENNF